ncbi:rhamnogalacturonan endolyase [Pelomonas saccharophila]|uniref:rhamnogalacturonan endolyase n=1 Tax=Roseateles saccharophilus TaxID=304 RepID=A0ABU1YLN6_ROSSA|nr:rhamnogalacturonan lyase B N-terminal domain-containing protein [Roseateles saccharophilus]MDR7269121.1 rhamnogalacturonan endolyase [Roseateles saccharophilus]
MRIDILRRRLRRLGAAAFVLLSMATATPALAAFSLTTLYDGGSSSKLQYQVDTGGGLVFKVMAYDNGVSTQSKGDLSSLLYNGVQYADASRGSQLNSGFDYLYSNVSAVDVQAQMISSTGAATPASTADGGVVSGGAYVKITVTVYSANGGVLKHYYMAKSGEPRIYMGSYFTEEPDTLNLVRFIVRVPVAVLSKGGPAGTPGGLASNGSWPQDLRGTDTTVEASDVFGFSSGTASSGQTRSKHYSNMRLKDWQYFGGVNSAGSVGLWFYRDNNEGNSGGPFYRSLLNQITSTSNELTYIVNYGEGQTEAFRLGVLNSYTLMFTNGGAPAAPDTSWFSLMALDGYVAASGRGTVAGVGLSGTDSAYTYTVGFSNATAQYWASANLANGGFFKSTGMRPGTYTLTVYKNELAVYTGSVTVTAGGTTALNTLAINADPSGTSALWRIGNWDGSPAEFLNGSRLTTMHPTDVRMSSWLPSTFVVGSSSAASGFPAYQWKDVNNARVIQFTLTSAQVRNLTLRLGTTADFNGARPQITVNSWTSAIPTAPPKGSRNLTVGTYRGVNRLYSFDIPSTALVAGTNTLTINVVSGTSGTAYLSPGLSYDAVDLIVTP